MLSSRIEISKLSDDPIKQYQFSAGSAKALPEGLNPAEASLAVEAYRCEPLIEVGQEPSQTASEGQKLVDDNGVTSPAMQPQEVTTKVTITAEPLLDPKAYAEHAREVDNLTVNELQDEAKECGLSFGDLVDRLLSQPMSKSDLKYTAIFLCLYRMFAAPSELLSSVVHRFRGLNDHDLPQVSRATSQLRFLAILAQWVSDYPGDFAHPRTRTAMTGFLSNLVGHRAFAVASKEIGLCLDNVAEDDDTHWAYSDLSRSRANTNESYFSLSSIESTVSTLNPDSSTEDVQAVAAAEFATKQQHKSKSGTSSLSSSTGRSDAQSTGSFQTLLNTVENAQRQAQLLTAIPRNALAKTQWHQLMDTPDDDIARELTRIDWIMFSSIRPRDLIRHVSLSGQQKERCRGLEHVNRLIGQFNHVAFWVANFVLLRDKAKHRARMLEKFMGIAWVSHSTLL